MKNINKQQYLTLDILKLFILSRHNCFTITLAFLPQSLFKTVKPYYETLNQIGTTTYAIRKDWSASDCNDGSIPMLCICDVKPSGTAMAILHNFVWLLSSEKRYDTTGGKIGKLQLIHFYSLETWLCTTFSVECTCRVVVRVLFTRLCFFFICKIRVKASVIHTGAAANFSSLYCGHSQTGVPSHAVTCCNDRIWSLWPAGIFAEARTASTPRYLSMIPSISKKRDDGDTSRAV